MSEPLVTCVLPLHNHEKWVGDAISSLCRQTYPNKQIVVVNDGSTDNSVGAVRDTLKYCQKIARDGQEMWLGKTKIEHVNLMLIDSSPARGPAFARNLGMRFSPKETSYYAFLDSDDYYHPEKIAKSVVSFQKDPRIGCTYSDFDTLSIETGIRLRQWKPSFNRDELLRECIINCDSLVSKDAVESCGGFFEELRVAEDFDFWLRVTEKYMAVHIPESLVTIRVGNHSSTATVPNELWQACYRKVMDRLKERLSRGA